MNDLSLEDLLEDLKTDLENFLFYEKILTKNLKYFYALCFNSKKVIPKEMHEVIKCVKEMNRSILDLKDRTFCCIHEIDGSCDKVEGYRDIISHGELLECTKINEDPVTMLNTSLKEASYMPRNQYYSIDSNQKGLFLGSNRGRILFFDRESMMSRVFPVSQNYDFYTIKLASYSQNDAGNQCGEFIIAMGAETRSNKEKENGICWLLKNYKINGNIEFEKKILFDCNNVDKRFQNFDLNSPCPSSENFIAGILGKKSNEEVCYRNLFDWNKEKICSISYRNKGPICSIKNILGDRFVVQTTQSIMLFRQQNFLQEIYSKEAPEVIFKIY